MSTFIENQINYIKESAYEDDDGLHFPDRSDFVHDVRTALLAAEKEGYRRAIGEVKEVVDNSKIDAELAVFFHEQKEYMPPIVKEEHYKKMMILKK